jgi:hypothetical protein
MLPLLSSPFYAFLYSFIPSFRSRFPSDALVLLTYLMSTHVSRYGNRFESLSEKWSVWYDGGPFGT